jgi:hypothetical protein
MRETSPRGWHRWRVTIVESAAAPTAGLGFDRMTRLKVTTVTTDTPAPMTYPEVPGVDGIRHELVARVRRQIAEGTYDTEEKWLAAEEALLRRIEGRG